ncbi:MAG: P22 coat protein - protein 5 domain protein, partial [Clostridia bacterium]|nr:P22 coat protein - protein 5 domain protein [Clostridia bacterium]
PKLMTLAMKNAASALANAADRYVYSLCTEAGSTITDTNVSPDSIIDCLIDARTKLFTKNVADASDIVIEVTPEIAGMILKAKVGLSTDNESALEAGCLGSIGGCKIYVSNNLLKSGTEAGVSHKCIARTKRAIAFAEQISEIDAYRPELRFADAVKGLHLYGAKVVYPDEMVLLNLTVANA